MRVCLAAYFVDNLVNVVPSSSCLGSHNALGIKEKTESRLTTNRQQFAYAAVKIYFCDASHCQDLWQKEKLILDSTKALPACDTTFRLASAIAALPITYRVAYRYWV